MCHSKVMLAVFFCFFLSCHAVIEQKKTDTKQTDMCTHISSGDAFPIGCVTSLSATAMRKQMKWLICLAYWPLLLSIKCATKMSAYLSLLGVVCVCIHKNSIGMNCMITLSKVPNDLFHMWNFHRHKFFNYSESNQHLKCVCTFNADSLSLSLSYSSFSYNKQATRGKQWQKPVQFSCCVC